MSKSTSINVDNIQKIFNVRVAGRITPKEEQEFLADYKAKTSAITPAQYTLEVDCTDMKVVTPDMTENLTQVMKMYKATGFKKVIYQVKSNVLLKMQLARLARNAGVIQEGQDVSVVDIG